jgi:hypothetical protein
MKRWGRLLIGGGVYLSAVLAFSPSVRRSTEPPLSGEFRQMQVQLCSYFDRHGKVPREVDFFPPELRQLVNNGQSGISWSSESQTLAYEYPKAYPVNRSLLTFLSFGLTSPGPSTAGSLTGPDMIRENTAIFKRAGLLKPESTL